MMAHVSPRVYAVFCLLALSSAGRADSTYPVSINLYSCPINSAGVCTPPGTLTVNGIVYNASSMANFPAGSTLSLVAIAGSGYVFGGWGQLAGVSGQTAVATVTVNGPLAITPIFSPASTVSVNIMTQPAGLQLTVDGAPIVGGTALAWAWFTNHTIAVVTPQQDPNGKWWVFAGWSDGGAASHTIAVRGGLYPDQFVARFIPAVPVDIISHPPGRHITIDGGADCVQCTMIWGRGETHSLTATPQQTDDQGLSYRFRYWSDLNAGPSKLFVPDPVPDRMQVTAIFDRLGVVNIDSDPMGIRMLVDDGECYTPCQLQKPLDKAVTVKAPASYPTGFGARLDFLNWGDAAGTSRTFKAGVDPQGSKAWFRSMRQITAAVDPDQGAQVTFDPPSPDGFYDANSKVNIAIAPQPGYRFDHWDGDLGGTAPGGWLTMGVPRQVMAHMHPIPYLAPHSVRNAATDLHAASVTACSIVTITGINLSTATEAVGAGLPQQFLAGTGVRMGSNMLPLYSVSPGEISAQLPCNLQEGPATLTVRSAYEPEVSTDFTVVRNAPGLFTQNVAGQTYAIAAHDDGSPVTPDNPAVDGETVTAYGTGFGPLMTPALEGIVIQPAAEFRLADSLEALLGSNSLTTTYVGASGPRPGMDAVQVRVSTGGGSSTFKVRVNGQESNTVTLPIAK